MMLINNPQNSLLARFPRRGCALLVLLLITAFSAAPSRAQTLVTNILYQDEFSTAGYLNGRTPDTVDEGTNVWIAGPDWGTDGAEAYEDTGLSCGFLPFTPLPGRVYMLSADLEDEPDGSGWTAMGFTGSANAGEGAYFAIGLNAVGWMLTGPAEAVSNYDQCFIGPNTLEGMEEAGFGGEFVDAPTNYTVVLDTRPSNPTNWTFTFLNGTTVMRPTQAFGTSGGESGGPVINYIGIGNGNGGDYSIVQDFTLTEIVSEQAPYIITQPKPSLAGTNFPGDTVVYTVLAGGYPDPTYQWQFNATNISGATNSSLTLDDVTFSDAGSYRVVLRNGAGGVTSAPVSLYLVLPLTNTIYADTFSGPGASLNGRTPDTADLGTNEWIASTSWIAGDTGVTNEAASSGDGNGPNAFLPFVPVPGQVYVLSGLLDDQAGGSGWIAIGYSGGDSTEGSFNMGTSVGWMLARDDGDPGANQTFIGPGTSGGANINDYSDGPATYSVTLDTRPTNPAEWAFSFQVNGVTLTPPTAFGGTGPAITYVGFGVYTGDSVTAQNFSLTAYSEPVKPYFTLPPQGGTFYVGETVTLSSTGGGALPLTYQWEKNSALIPGATNSTLTLSGLTAANAGSYQLVVSNPLGSTASAAAVVVVTNPPTALNLTSNLVLHLKFDGDYLDYSGRGNNATSVGASIVPGIVGSGAMEYGNNGSANDLGYVTLGKPSDLFFSNNVSFTVSYWIQYPNVADNQQNGSYPPYAFPSCDLPIIGNVGGSTYNPGWVIAQGGENCEGNPGGFIWTLNDTSARVVAAAGPAHSEDDGNWHHLIHIFDRNAGFGTTYLDGVQVDSTDISSIGAVDQVANSITLGQDPTGGYSSAGAGYLDDLSIWRRALSGNEARAIYEAGLSNHVGVASQPLPITAAVSSGVLTVTWSAGVLESASSLSGPWTPVTGATTPSYTTSAKSALLFYRAAQ